MQELKLDLQGAKAATEKAAASGHKHQAAVAQLTGDNLVLVLRAKAAEDEVTALKKEREELRAAIDEQRGPWFDEVLPLRQPYTGFPADVRGDGLLLTACAPCASSSSAPLLSECHC